MMSDNSLPPSQRSTVFTDCHPVNVDPEKKLDGQVAQDVIPTDKGDEERFLVTFSPGDPHNPKSWSRAKRWFLTLFCGILVLNATFASSAPSGIAENLMNHFHFSEEIASLTISVFVAGYCVGPLLWGPLSEQYGRRPIFIIAFTIYTCFQIGSALAQNTASVLVFRFLGGVFAACPLTNSGAVISDIWDSDTRGKALALFTLGPFAGPSLGPVVGGYISVSGVSWRWLFWVLTFFSAACLVIIVVALPETYTPILLVEEARRMRKETGDERYHAPLEEHEKAPFRERLEVILGRPFKMLIREPMLLALTIYMSFVYGCIYLLFEAYPIVFSEGHGFSAGSLGLTFLPVTIGGSAAVVAYYFIFNPRYEKAIAKYDPNPVPPEVRLELAKYGAPVFAIAFFWFGWTSYPSISYWAPMLSGLAIGWASIFIFLALFNYIIDAYLQVAASALAANTVVRSFAGAGFPLFASQMFEKLNPRWASTLLGFIAILLLPIPFILARYGAFIREKSKYASA